MTQPSGYIGFIRKNLPFLAVGFLLTFISGLGQTYFIAIFGAEIRSEFGLSNGDWGLLYMLGTGLSAIVMVFAGTLADRYRTRSLSAIVIGVLAIGCLSLAYATSVPALFVIVFLLRFAGQGMAGHLAVVAMSRWFIATRGRAIAVASMGFMIGEATMPLIMVWLKSFVDWRTLWICFSIFALVLIPILSILLSKERQPNAEEDTDHSSGMNGLHWTRSMAIRNPIFWLLAPAVMLLPTFGTAFWFHQTHFADLKGWTHLQLVSVFPLGTISLAFSTIAYGWLIDRLGAVRLLPFYLAPALIAYALHWAATDIYVVAVAVMLMGFAGGGQATVLSACWAEIYGTRFLGAIKSAVAALMVAGSALGPWITGVMIDIGIGFDWQLLIIGLVFGLACLFQTIPRRKILSMSL